MKRIRKIGFSNFIFLISSLILVIILIAFSFIKNSVSADKISHTWEVKNTIRRISSTLSEMQSNKLAYIYTSHIKYKHAFNASHQEYDSLFSTLEDLVSDNQLQMDRLKHVGEIVDNDLANLGDLNSSIDKSKLTQYAESKESSLVANNVQAYFNEMLSSENKLLEERNHNYDVWKIVILIALGIATIIIVLSLYSLINRMKPLIEELVDTKENLEKSNRNLSSTLEQLKISNQQKEIEIKAREQVMKETEKLNNSLLAKNQQLDHFAYVASHDLQEPLRTVSNYLEIFQEDYPERVEGEASMYFEFINSAVERMRKLISGLLSFSRLGTSGAAEKIDLNEVLENIKEDFSTVIEERNIEIESAILPEVVGFKIELKQLFQNLISNAIKFTKPDTAPHIKISFDETDNFYNFHVADNGIGIPDKDFTKIFDMFSRLHAIKDYEGQGIGLAFCKKIIELHHGNIWVTSDFGKGTIVHFTLKI